MARRGVAGKLFLLVFLALLAGGAWFFRDLIPGLWQREPVPLEVSEQAAVSAEEKLKRLRQEGDTVHMSGVEFTSYLRFRMAGRFAPEIEMPSVAFEGDQVKVAGRYPTDRLPRDFARVAEFLPDTADVAVNGTLRTVAPGRAALKVGSASFARIPVPRERLNQVIDRLRGVDQSGLEQDEVAFQLFPGVGSARVENGILILAR
ncbi:MAG: hypothetical protein KY444_02955 [Gemmatimonadetes bacterium]|nr:hypothetical protein [Gemmatimonadota bacterium]